MKRNIVSCARKVFLTVFLLAGVAFWTVFSLLSSPANAASADPGGVVENAEPGFWVMRENRRIPLEDGDGVYEFDIIQTDASGYGVIRFNDDSILEIGSSSEVDLRFMIFSSARARLNVGILQGVARFISGGIVKINPRFLKLTTPKSAIGIRGTTLLVEESFNSETVTGEDLAEGHYIILTNNKTYEICTITGNGGFVHTDENDTMTTSGAAQKGITYSSVTAIRNSMRQAVTGGNGEGGGGSDGGGCRDSSNTASGHRDSSRSQ